MSDEICYRCDTRILNESGYEEALYGIGFNKGISSKYIFAGVGYFSYNSMPEKERLQLKEVAEKLASKDGGHNKFLEHIMLWIVVRAPRYVWQEMDTFRLSSKNSESTMHTLIKSLKNKNLDEVKEMFEPNSITDEKIMQFMIITSEYNENDALLLIKKQLPEGFLQKRLWVMSYKTLRNIAMQRMTHRLPHWKKFLRDVYAQAEHPELLPELKY